MATDLSFIEYVNSQSGLGAAMTHKRMFGEYAIYLEGKVVGFACDNQLYVKPTDEGRAVLGRVNEHPPYPGAKLHFRLDAELEDRELLQRLLRVTARALPLPKPKAKPKAKPKVEPKAGPEAEPKAERAATKAAAKPTKPTKPAK